MQQTDATRKYRIVLIVGALSLIGFFLEAGPIGGAFSLSNAGLPVNASLTLEMATLGFLAYLALAASAAVGLHLGEEEPTPKETKDEEETPPIEPVIGTVEMPREPEGAAERVRVRPELSQMRMFFTALAGYGVLKGISLTIMFSSLRSAAVLLQAFSFGLLFTAIGWFLMWQFLRWYAQEKRWIRLQDELVGGDVFRVIGVVLLFKPAGFLYALIMGRFALNDSLILLAALLHLTLVAAAVLLWLATPTTFRRTLIGLGITGVVIVILTLVLAVVEKTYV